MSEVRKPSLAIRAVHGATLRDADGVAPAWVQHDHYVFSAPQVSLHAGLARLVARRASAR